MQPDSILSGSQVSMLVLTMAELPRRLHADLLSGQGLRSRPGTENSGTPAKPVDTWIHSGQACNPGNWTTNTWHHVQITYSDSGGNVTYQAVYLDGAEQVISATVNSDFSLGWSPTLLTNFQTDGKTASGVIEAYLDELTVSRW